MNDKICFVIMGFGKKTDNSTGKTIDLDKTYKNIIKPAATQCGYRCVRADEIKQSAIIDKSMYGLLLCADLVIADISTYNPNAIYELGVRHAVRPFYTIILKEKEGNLPFDLSHISIMPYEHLGDDIGVDESKRCIEELKKIIKSIEVKKINDSPFYEYIKTVKAPKIEKSELEEIIKELADEHQSLFAIVEQAKILRSKKDFEGAYELWKKASELKKSEHYYIQQQALCKYKSEQPSKQMALVQAATIINELIKDGDMNNDPETLGIAGAIYKNMYLDSGDIEALEKAIKYYETGFSIRKDYYNGENYALCLNMKANIINDEEEKIYYKVRAKKVRKEIINMLKKIENKDFRKDRFWIYATLAHCYYGLGDKNMGDKYEEKFKETKEEEWNYDTYIKNKKELFNVLGFEYY